MSSTGPAEAHDAPGSPVHVPVLLERVTDLLGPACAAPGAVLVDATLGLAGHSLALLDAHPGLRLVGLDRDPDARADLRARVLAPLADLRPSTAEKLAETLRSWLLHHGRRDAVAEELFVHAQTVRYRVQQLREVYGDRLEDPAFVLEATLALA